MQEHLIKEIETFSTEETLELGRQLGHKAMDKRLIPIFL